MVKKVSEFKTAKLYAKALYDSAEDDGIMAQIRRDVETLQSIGFAQMPETSYFCSPIVENDVKISLLEAVGEKLNLCVQTQNFLKLLILNEKFKLLNLVFDDFVGLYNQKHGIAEVTVETVIKLSDKQNKLLCEKLAKVFDKQIKINYAVKPEILGGLIIKNGTTLIDLSLKNKLNKLEQLMKGTD